MATLEEIQDAYFFVNSDSYGMHRALLCIDSGRIYYQSEMGGFDEEELDEENFDCEKFIEIPHKDEIGLGETLVMEFVQDMMPEDLGRVQRIFCDRGAYRRFKDLLEFRGLLQSWYDFESKREEEALRRWVAENEIKLL